ncbi:MAG: hypothetical protein WCC60_01975, partial [Ilumatobacteraceae bacterium]
MRTEELLDEDDLDLDRVLRGALPPMPRSRAWERTQRDALLAFISTSAEAGAMPPASTPAAVDVRVHQTRVARRHRSVELAVGVAAAILLVVGLIVVTRSHAPDDAATPSGGATSPSAPAVPALPPSPLRPDLFPLLPAGAAHADEASAMYGGQIGWENPAASEALVARMVGDAMSAGIRLQVLSSFEIDQASFTAAEVITVAGTEMKLYVDDRGSPTTRSVVLPGSPTLMASGLDPVA